MEINNMAQLSSPGVSVSVIDESFYTPAAPGTTPLIIVATAQDKSNGAGTGTAAGTLQANAGQVYLLTSQKDLSDTFGTPVFKTDANNNPVHAGEQNEFGLQAAYSYLGVSNRAYVVRADVDLNELDASPDAPTGAPNSGTYWLDTANTAFGLFEWNSATEDVTGGQSFTVKYPVVITDSAKVTGQNAPKPSIGSIGEYAVVALPDVDLVKIWYKKALTDTAAGTWVEVGSSAWVKSRPTVVGTKTETILVGDTLVINGTTITGATTLDGLVADINAGADGNPDADNDSAVIPGVTAASVNGKLELYSTGAGAGFDGAPTGSISLSGTLVAKLGLYAVEGENTPVYLAPTLAIAPHYQVPTFKRTDNTTTAIGRPTGSVWVKTTNPNAGARWRVKRYNDATQAFVELTSPLYANNQAALAGIDAAGGGINLAVGTTYVKYNDAGNSPALANFKVYARSGVGATVVSTKTISTQFTAGAVSFTIAESLVGSSTLADPITVSFTANHTVADAVSMAEAINNPQAGQFVNISAEAVNGVVTITHKTGGDFLIANMSGFTNTVFPIDVTGSRITVDPTDSGNATKALASLWEPAIDYNADYTQGPDQPTTTTADGRLWYNSIVDEVDIMVHDGSGWVGYLNYIQNQGGGGTTDANGPIVSATKPTKQSDGSSPLANGDIWIDTSDVENYPTIYKFNYALQKWTLVDKADQSTESGILFRDARQGTSGGSATIAPAGTIQELLTSDFLDFDAPDPALYPKGMLLWNLRRSGFNVKRFVRDYIDVTADNARMAGEAMTAYYPHRWLSEAANEEDGSGTFGRKAQRKVVVQALQALVNSNQQIRDEESRVFNLIACPGYSELVGEMVSLNYDRGLTAFIVADTPARLTPDATTLSNWGNNQNGALEDNDKGLVSSDEYLGFFYPWGYTSDNIGNNIAVPPSHMILRTIALNDQVAYPWFAPAGTRRGGITNATAVGYITAEGEFQSVALNNGQRDTLASIKVNPITFITGTGLVNYGQYTRAKNASSLDRINVARLVIYLRRQFAQLAKPYVFEPNDKITRDEIKGAAESLLLELVGQRALYDYLVVCDESNNTPARIDRNELYLDVAIEPVKAVEFIYIPLRLKNTGEIAGLA
jgi:hypothetical protein